MNKEQRGTPVVQLAALSARSPRCGLIAPKDLPKLTKAAGHDACACADRHYAAQIPAMLKAAREAKMPIVLGLWLDLAEAALDTDHRGPPPGPPGDLMVWAKTHRGIETLAQLSTLAMTREPQGQIRAAELDTTARTDIGICAATVQCAEALEERHEGVAVLPDAIRERNDQRTFAERTMLRLAERTNRPAVGMWPYIARSEDEREPAAVISASARSATIEARRKNLPERISLLERETLISKADPGLLNNASALARTAKAWTEPTRQRFARLDSTPERDHSDLEAMAWSGLEHKLGHEPNDQYQDRLREELDVIRETSFAGLFLAVREILEWARKQGGLTGPARGSSAASLVAWAIDINAPDPIREELLFARFLSRNRSVAPDFDLDFEPRHRAAAQLKMMQLWGAQRSARICSWASYEEKMAAAKGKLAGKQAIRSSLRAYGVPPKSADAMIDEWANGETPGAGRDGERFALALANAEPMRDATNALSRHASAIMLSPEPISGRLALCKESGEDELVAVQVDHKEAEEFTGAAKADCLAIDALTVIATTRSDANITTDPWSHEPEAGDEEAYARITHGETTGLFQLEGDGITRAAATLKIESFDDVRALVAMYRPGPIDNIEPMGRRKRGEEPSHAPHPVLDELLAETQGIIVYQEQAIRASQLMAGFSAAEADKLRAAISKKKETEVRALKQRFYDGSRATHAMDEREITTVWEAIEKQSGYAFNRAHATGYAMITRATARMREQAPGHFLAALVDVAAQAGKKREDKLSRITVAAAAEGIEIRPPDPCNPTRRSRAIRDEEGNVYIQCALGVLPGVGRQTEERWGAQPGDGQRADPVIAEQWLRESVGMTASAIEELLNARNLDRFPDGAPERLPPRHLRESITTRGNLKALAHAYEAGEGERFKALAIIEKVDEQWVTLNDGDARVRARHERKGKRTGREPIVGEAVIALLAGGETAKCEGAMRWMEAEQRWPESIRVTLGHQAAGERAHAIKTALDAYRPGSGRVLLRMQTPGGGTIDLKTDMKVAIRKGIDRAIRAAAEPYANQCTVTVLRQVAPRHRNAAGEEPAGC